MPVISRIAALAAKGRSAAIGGRLSAQGKACATQAERYIL